MKFLILFMLMISSAWSKPLVLITYYDAFGQASFNSSDIVAQQLALRLNTATANFEVKLCKLNTIFDKAYAQTEECLKALPEAPVMILGLGESTCDLKIETIMRNQDKTAGPDNGGNQRNNTAIIPGAEYALGLRYPLAQMYCALSEKERDSIQVSNNAGSFVCNNTAYQLSYYHAEIPSGFIHVPANNCSNLARKTDTTIFMLERMIPQGVDYLLNKEADPGLPHSSNDLRFLTRKQDLKILRKDYARRDKCLHEFLERTKAADERRSIFGLE